MDAYLNAGPPAKGSQKRPPPTPAMGAASSKAKSMSLSGGASSFLSPADKDKDKDTKKRRGKKQLQRLSAGGSAEDRLRRCEQWLEALGLVVLAHERELCQIRRETNKVISFETEVNMLEGLDNAKHLWDSKRVAGQRHEDGAFRHIALTVFEKQARTAVEASSDIMDPEATLANLDILAASKDVCQRFFLLRIQKPGPEQDSNKPVALLVWKFDQTTDQGVKAMNALLSLDEDGTLHQLFQATIREDRAPMGGLCRAIQEALRKKD